MNFYPVSCEWADGDGKHQGHSVAAGATAAEALQSFQAANRHVRAELVTENISTTDKHE